MVSVSQVKMLSQSRRNYLLLEVMIAFFLLVLCALPLLYPHGYMLSTEKRFVKTIELDRTVDLIYASIVQSLYHNEINWDDIEQGTWKPFDSKHLSNLQGFKGKFQIHRDTSNRFNEKSAEKAHIYFINMEFTADDNAQKKLDYQYSIVIQRKLKNTGAKEQDKIGTPATPETPSPEGK